MSGELLLSWEKSGNRIEFSAPRMVQTYTVHNSIQLAILLLIRFSLNYFPIFFFHLISHYALTLIYRVYLRVFRAHETYSRPYSIWIWTLLTFRFSKMFGTWLLLASTSAQRIIPTRRQRRALVELRMSELAHNKLDIQHNFCFQFYLNRFSRWEKLPTIWNKRPCLEHEMYRSLHNSQMPNGTSNQSFISPLL